LNQLRFAEVKSREKPERNASNKSYFYSEN